GLLCTVEPPTLHVSGPFALFHHTMLYGRALGQLLGFLCWCGDFALTAECRLRGRLGQLQLSSADPILPGTQPKPFHRQVEARSPADLRRAAPDGDLLREPEPLSAGPTLIFPDFLLRHRFDESRQFLIEIVGFWTADYLEKKLARLGSAKIGNLILCI